MDQSTEPMIAIPEPSHSSSNVSTRQSTQNSTAPQTEGSLPDYEPVSLQIEHQEGDHRGKTARFFRKYFLEGQRLTSHHAGKHQVKCSEHEQALFDVTMPVMDSPPPQYSPLSSSPQSRRQSNSTLKFHEKYRKYIAFLLPFGFMHLVWWTLAIRYNIFQLYPTRYELAVTMILGATVAGMTSEGGGAIAFPVMTLLLKIDPKVARDFSLMIQSCGMTSAAFTIIWMKIQLEWHSIIVCSVGATVGIITGLEFVDDLLTGPQKKMLFVAIWFSFALSLFLLNTQKKRVTYETIQNFNSWKFAVLFVTGFIGGLCSAFAGSGVDICSFSVLTLLFRVSEKVATPTSVVLMAVNTCVGFFWRHLIMSDVSQLAWEYFSVSVPVVVICAPMGSLLASHFHRLVLAGAVYVLEIAAVIGFLLTRPDPILVLIGVGIVLASFAFFLGLSKLGKKLHEGSDKGRTPVGCEKYVIRPINDRRIKESDFV
ncbi:sulfite exporter tauE/SafE domain-containing protein [Ditylenchus destructor]|nr:sulfite exporter tauE/SafE domain-containing protein [Ditylenchus destructor]